MKKYISIHFVAVLILGFASCNKCVTCTYEDSSTSSEEICEGDFGTEAEFDFVVGVAEAFGATCEWINQ